jgi:hypothetical protein
VGTKLFVSDNANIELVAVSAISGNDVTFSSFVSSYSAGSKFCMERTEFVQNQNNASGTHSLMIGHNGAKNHSVSPADISAGNPTLGDGLTGEYPGRSRFFTSTTALVGPQKNVVVSGSQFTAETIHDISGENYKYFLLFSGFHILIKEV